MLSSGRAGSLAHTSAPLTGGSVFVTLGNVDQLLHLFGTAQPRALFALPVRRSSRPRRLTLPLLYAANARVPYGRFLIIHETDTRPETLPDSRASGIWSTRIIKKKLKKFRHTFRVKWNDFMKDPGSPGRWADTPMIEQIRLRFRRL